MTSTGSKKNQNQNSWKGLLVWILIALLLRWQAVEPRWIPSGSMIPTLQIQDRILIEKITPRLNNKLNKHLNLNTIVIFKPPKILTEAGYSDGSALIKRVVGLPGDKIEVTDGKLYRNGKEIPIDTLELKKDKLIYAYKHCPKYVSCCHDEFISD